MAKKLSHGQTLPNPADARVDSNQSSDSGDFQFLNPNPPNSEPSPNARIDTAEERTDVVQHVHFHHGTQQHRFNPQFHQQQSDTRRQDNYPRFQQQQFQGSRGNRNLRPQPAQNNINNFFSSFNPLPSLNPFKFFEAAEPKKPISFQQQRPQSRPDQSYLETLNAIQTIPSPDLSKFGPPIIELDSKDGQIVVGQPFNRGTEKDHLAGFVSLDFDGFTSGEPEDKTRNKLSLLVGGNQNFDKDVESGLVNLLNSEKEDPPTFVQNSDKDAPAGFTKIDIPFMDPTDHTGVLPKVFIAPIGKPIPKGYKGKPLLSEPTGVQTTTETILLVESPYSTEKPLFRFQEIKSKPNTKIEEEKPTTSTQAPVRNFRFKTQKERPSLSRFYLKNKEKLETLSRKPEKVEKYDKYEKYSKTRFVEASREELKEEVTTLAPPTTTIFLPTDNRQTFSTQTFQDDENTSRFGEENEEKDDLTTTVSVTDEDPISLVYEPSLVIQSTFEQAVADATTTTTTTEEPTTSITTTASTTTTEFTTTTVFTTTSSTTTTTSTTATTTEEITVSTTETPVVRIYKTTQDPRERLEILRQQAEIRTQNQFYVGDLQTGEEVEEQQAVEEEEEKEEKEVEHEDEEDITEAPVLALARPLKPRLRFRKFKGLGPNSEGGVEAGNRNGAIKKFGKRIRTRKRPLFWPNNRFEEEAQGVEPTQRPGQFRPRGNNAIQTSTEFSTTQEPIKTEEFKKKFRPFFDKLYSKFAKNPEDETETGTDPISRRFELPRKRSTTAFPPITVGKNIIFLKKPQF